MRLFFMFSLMSVASLLVACGDSALKASTPSVEAIRAVVSRNSISTGQMRLFVKDELRFSVVGDTSADPRSLCEFFSDHTANLTKTPYGAKPIYQGMGTTITNRSGAYDFRGIPNKSFGQGMPISLTAARFTLNPATGAKWVYCDFKLNREVLASREGVSGVTECVHMASPAFCFDELYSQIKDINVKFSDIGELNGQKYRYADWIGTSTTYADPDPMKVLYGISPATTCHVSGRITLTYDGADKKWSIGSFVAGPKVSCTQSAAPTTPTKQALTAPEPNSSAIAASSPSVELNPRWYGTWINRKTGDKLIASASQFRGCNWVGSIAAIPKGAGCWAYYDAKSLTVSELIGAGQDKIDSESSALAKSLSQTDHYKTVTVNTYDVRGDRVGDDGGSIFFLDRDRVLMRTWSLEGTDGVVRLDLLTKEAN